MRSIKDLRLKDYDYSNDGCYFVTICTDYRRPYLAKYRRIAEQGLERLNTVKGVRVDFASVMPTHIHAILVLSECPLRLGEVVRRFKAVASKEAGFPLWQPNYYEHVIRNEKALQKIRQYIQNNPLAEEIACEQFYR